MTPGLRATERGASALLPAAPAGAELPLESFAAGRAGPRRCGHDATTDVFDGAACCRFPARGDAKLRPAFRRRQFAGRAGEVLVADPAGYSLRLEQTAEVGDQQRVRRAEHHSFAHPANHAQWPVAERVSPPAAAGPAGTGPGGRGTVLPPTGPAPVRVRPLRMPRRAAQWRACGRHSRRAGTS